MNPTAINTRYRPMYRTKSSINGFSLVELMIGMTLGLVGMLIVAQVMSTNASFQASTNAAGEAQTVGNLSLYTIERDLKQAGFGISTPSLLGCQLTGWSNSSSSVISQPLYPVSIDDGATADDSDAITIAYGTSETRMGSVALASTYDGSASDINVQNRFGYFIGDFFVLAQITNPATNCVMGQITAIPSTSLTALSHAASAQNYNRANGENISFNPQIAEFYNLGGGFTFNTYSVNANHQLIQKSNLSGNSAAIAENVYVFKARYGHDSDGDGTVDTWDAVVPTTTTAWGRTTNVRIGLAVKSPQREASLVSTSTLQLWPDGPTVTLSSEDQHYRYRTYNSIVPIRNMIWRTF